MGSVITEAQMRPARYERRTSTTRLYYACGGACACALRRAAAHEIREGKQLQRAVETMLLPRLRWDAQELGVHLHRIPDWIAGSTKRRRMFQRMSSSTILASTRALRSRRIKTCGERRLRKAASSLSNSTCSFGINICGGTLRATMSPQMNAARVWYLRRPSALTFGLARLRFTQKTFPSHHLGVIIRPRRPCSVVAPYANRARLCNNS